MTRQDEIERSDNTWSDDRFVVEDDFAYFCTYDDLTGVVASHNIELPAIADSCYVDRADVFLPPKT